MADTLTTLPADGKLPDTLTGFPDSALAQAWCAEKGGKIGFYALVNGTAELQGYWTGSGGYRHPQSGQIMPSTVPPQFRSVDALSASEIYERDRKPAPQAPDWEWNPIRQITHKPADWIAHIHFDVGAEMPAINFFDSNMPNDEIVIEVDKSGNATLDAAGTLKCVKLGKFTLFAHIKGRPEYHTELELEVKPYVAPVPAAPKYEPKPGQPADQYTQTLTPVPDLKGKAPHVSSRDPWSAMWTVSSGHLQAQSNISVDQAIHNWNTLIDGLKHP